MDGLLTISSVLENKSLTCSTLEESHRLVYTDLFRQFQSFSILRAASTTLSPEFENLPRRAQPDRPYYDTCLIRWQHDKILPITIGI